MGSLKWGWAILEFAFHLWWRLRVVYLLPCRLPTVVRLRDVWRGHFDQTWRNTIKAWSHFDWLPYSLCWPFVYLIPALLPYRVHLHFIAHPLLLLHKGLLSRTCQALKTVDFRTERFFGAYLAPILVQWPLVPCAHLLTKLHDLCGDRDDECNVCGWSPDILVKRAGWF